jgi:hypothetical protein
MINRLFSKNVLTVFLLVLLIPTYSALLQSGYFPMHDDMQAMRLLQIDKCISDGQIPCRWVPDMGFGYGYPQFNYYAPLPYYVMEIFHLVGFGFLDSVKIGFSLSIVVGALGMFLLGRSLWGRVGGLVSALVFTYAPYKAVDLYVRGAMGELWGIAALPFLFWSARELVLGKRLGKLFFALSFSSLLASHNITALIFVPITFIWIIYLLITGKHGSPGIKLWRKLKSIFLSYLWGGLLAAFFVLPAVHETKFVHVETLLDGYFNYINHFVSIRQLLLDTHWQYGTSEIGSYDDILLSVGLVQWIMPLVALVLFLILKIKKVFKLSLFLTLAGWLVLFMAHSRSSFIWESISYLAYLQFPWRFLIFATFFFSLAAGSIVKVFSQTSKLSILSLVVFITVIYMLNVSYFRPRTWLDTTDSEKFSGEAWQLQQTISIFDYLPIYAEKPPAQKAPEYPVVIEGEVDYLSTAKGSNWQTWDMDLHDQSAKLELPILYFPDWRVMADGKNIPINITDNTGLIEVGVAAGTAKIEAKLFNTPIRNLANLMSLAGLIAVPVYLKKKK